MSSFTLTFWTDDYGEVSLQAALDTGEFKAECHYWSAVGEFADLVEALGTFPITTTKPLDMLWCDNCVELRIEPLDSVGHLSVIVSLREFGSDWNLCRSQFATAYGELDRFRSQLEGVIAQGAGQAILHSY